MDLNISTRFRSSDSDLTIQSSPTGHIFQVHKRNLESHSNILSTHSPQKPSSIHLHAALSIPPNPIIILPESGTILEILLQYMYHQPQPDLSALDFETLLALAEAAEKYQVYSALEICRVYLSLSIPDYPLRVLSFALKHNRTSLMDAAAKETIGEPLESLISALQPHHFVAWVKYHRAWMDTLSSLYQFRDPLLRHWEGSKDSSDGPHTKLMVNPCEVWAELWGTVAHQLQGKPEMLLHVDEVFRHTRELLGLRCRACERLIVDWQAEVEWGIEKIPKMSTYL